MFDISKPRFDPLGSSKVIGQGQYGKSIYGFLLEVNSNHHRQTHRLEDIDDFQSEPFFRNPSLTLWGHRSPKVKVDLGPPYMGSY